MCFPTGGARGLLIGIALGVLINRAAYFVWYRSSVWRELSMAEILCPKCGQPNPDFLDACQFCQTPLKSESSLQFGAKPTKKNTGELESVLPDWLKGVRQQARESTEEEVAPAAQSETEKNDPIDLLQDWLRRRRKPTKKIFPIG